MKRQVVNFYNHLRNTVIAFCHVILFSKIKEENEVSKILIVRKGTLGDHIVCEPIYHGIRQHFKSADIHLLTSVGKHKLTSIKGLPQKKYFSQIFFFEDKNIKSHYRKVKEERYDLVVELPQELDSIWVQIRNMFFFRMAGIKSGVGWLAGNHNLFTKWQYFNFNFKRIWQIHARSLNNSLGIKFKEVYLGIEKYDVDLNLPKEYIVVCPEAKFASKMWAIENYEKLVSALLSLGHKVVVLGQKVQLDLPEDPNYFNLVGKTDLQELQMVIKKAKIFIGNDSGPMHIAYSNGTALIALFGTRNYPKLWWPPESEKNVVLHMPEKASRYAFIKNKTLKERSDEALNSITVAEVIKALKLIK